MRTVDEGGFLGVFHDSCMRYRVEERHTPHMGRYERLQQRLSDSLPSESPRILQPLPESTPADAL